jgi:hypothetical protein
VPTSDHFNVLPLLTVLVNLQPRSVLDVGCGFGKYGLLAREYLDVWHGRIQKPTWQARIEAIEGFEGYRNPIWEYVYDRVHMGDARAVLKTLEGPFDVAILADVIEHLEMNDARELVGLLLDRCRVVLVSTPKEFYAQAAEHGNELERHKILWTARDFPDGAHVATIPMVSCHVYVASRATLPADALALASPGDLVYLQSRSKLGAPGLPLSIALRALVRAVT